MGKRKGITILLGILLIVLILIQFIPSGIPATSADNEHDLILTKRVEEEVAGILRTSCYDCHSNETRFPWYGYIAPAKWLVIKDINEGREELNFSEWNTLEKREQIGIIEDMMEEIEGGHMPLPVYTIIHRDAKLSDEQKEKLSAWSEDVIEQIFGE